MVKWKEVREKIDDGVKTYYTINTWRLDPPAPDTSPYPNRAIQYPAQDISLSKSATGVDFTAVLHYEVQYRAPDATEYHDLPLQPLESLLLGGIAYVIQRAPIGSNIEGSSPGLVVERSPANMEWLIKIPLTFYVTCRDLDPDDTTAIQPPLSSPVPFVISTITQDIKQYPGY